MSTVRFDKDKKSIFTSLIKKGIPLEKVKSDTQFAGCSQKQIEKYVMDLRKDPTISKLLPSLDIKADLHGLDLSNPLETGGSRMNQLGLLSGVAGVVEIEDEGEEPEIEFLLRMGLLLLGASVDYWFISVPVNDVFEIRLSTVSPEMVKISYTPTNQISKVVPLFKLRQSEMASVRGGGSGLILELKPPYAVNIASVEVDKKRYHIKIGEDGEGEDIKEVYALWKFSFAREEKLYSDAA
jgi:hypothetical protein